jgi:hypothetical protein
MNDRRYDPWVDEAVRLLGETGGQGRLEVQGTSMLPTLRPDEAIWIDFAPADRRAGQIVIFRQAGALLVHRIVGRKGAHFRIRGDHAACFDGPTNPDQILGRVVAFERGGRWYSLEGFLATIYAKAIAVHAFFYTGLGAVVERIRPSSRVRNLIFQVDTLTLSLASGIAFRLCHRVRDPPAILDDPSSGS